jgi:histidinol-phosphate aminotransferase
MNRVRQPFNCNLVAQAAAQAALGDLDYVEQSRKTNAQEKQKLYQALAALGVQYIPSEGNFIMLNLNQSGEAIAQQLLQQGIIVRPITGYGFPNSIRVTIGTCRQNVRLIETLTTIL